MGKPRLIVLIRHAQSEGNKNRSVHQIIPDHRVKLTDDGWRQAEDAGRRLRALLTPTDTLQIYTSPYRRTRETTEGILRTLLSAHGGSRDDAPLAPSISRTKITVYEEPRLREQDFGNFQPDSTAMAKMWQERADYGHFFYRIPNGESAADAYDRISGFNETLWRQFGEASFPSVCVLVTHGLMTRVFLMKWYHWSVEYFEDLRNVNHCEFILMQQNPENGKYLLRSQLRTWSELKRQRAAEQSRSEMDNGRDRAKSEQQRGAMTAAQKARHDDPHIKDPQRRNTLSNFLKHVHDSPVVKASIAEDGEKVGEMSLPPPPQSETDSERMTANEASDTPVDASGLPARPKAEGTSDPGPSYLSTSTPVMDSLSNTSFCATVAPSNLRENINATNGSNTPHEMSEDEEYFTQSLPPAAAGSRAQHSIRQGSGRSIPSARAMLGRPPQRQPTPEDIEKWTQESGMGVGTKADALGDEPPAGEAEVTNADPTLREQERRDRSIGGSVY